MAIVNGGTGGAAFNGGTITGPLTIDLSGSDGSTVPLTVLASFNGQSVDFTRVVNSDNSRTLSEIDANANFNMYTFDTGVLRGSAFSKSSGADFQSKNGYTTQAITSGALPTVTLVSGVAHQAATSTRDAYLVVPCTFTPTAGAAATVTVELSPDNVTFSTVAVVTEPAGVALDGTVLPVTVFMPATWYVKLTAVNATLGTGTWY